MNKCPWNWRYLVADDLAVREQVQSSINEIKDESIKNLYQKLLNFFSLKNVITSPAKRLNEYLSIILTEDQILYIKNYKPEQIKLPEVTILSDFEKTIYKYIKKLNCKIRFDIELVDDDSGFAEYWPTLLTDEKKDKLIVFKNPNTLDKENLELTLVHEIMGHGVFYNEIKKTNNSFVDHGCVLIEGYPTFVEWQEISSRARFNKSLAIKVLQSSMLGLETDIEMHYLSAGYTKEMIRKYLSNYQTMTGYVESYTIGALMLERKFNTEIPIKKMKELLDDGCGDHLLHNL